MSFKKYLNLRLVGIGILVWLLFQIDISLVFRMLLQSHFTLIALALLFIVMSVCLKFLRYQYILIQQGVRNRFLKTLQFSLVGLYLSFITPGRVGEVSKAYFIHKACDASLNRLVAGSFLDRIFDIYALLLTALLGFVVMNPVAINPAPIILILIIIASLPVVFLLPVVRHISICFTGWIQRTITHADTWSDQLLLFFSEIDSLLNRKLFWGLAATSAAYAFFFGSCYYMSLSLTIPLSYCKIAVFIACANILSFLPISFAGIGTREACLVYFFLQEGLSSELALAFSTLVFSFTYLLFGVVGFLCLMTLKYDSKSLPASF